MCPQRRAVMQSLSSAYLPLVPWLKDPIDCLMPLWAVAKTGYGWGQGQGGEVPLAEALLRRLGQGGSELVARCNDQDHSQLWWSLSEAPVEVAVGQAQLLTTSATRLVEMGPQDVGPQPCANILLACARLLPHVGIGDPAPLLHHLIDCLVQRQEKATSQEIANSLYALGRLHERCGHTPLPEHLQGLAAGVLERLSGQAVGRSERLRFTPQAMSNMLWACAKLRYAHPELLGRLAGAAAEAAGRMNGQDLGNTLWALGRLVEAGCLDGSSGVPGVQRLAEEAQQRAQQRRSVFEEQELANMLLGLAYLQSGSAFGTYELTAAVEALAAECRVVAGRQRFRPQGLANAAWALAKLGYGGQAWYAACAEAALQPAFCTTTVPQDWSNLWWALAQARHLPSDAPLLVARTAKAMAALQPKVERQHCSNMLWALTTLGLYDRPLVGCLLGRLAELLPLATPQHVSNTLWAVAVMGPAALSAHVAEVAALLREVASMWQGGGERAAYAEEGLSQLWQAQVELEAHPAPEVRALAAILPGVPGGGVSLGSAMERAAARMKQHSVAQRVGKELATALQRQQDWQPGLQGGAAARGGAANPMLHGTDTPFTILSAAEGVFVPQVCRWADVDLRLEGGRAVAVMVHTQSSALANQTGVPLGITLFCRRQLQRVYGEGNVVGVFAQEWDSLGGDVGRQGTLLRALLLQRGGGQVQAQPGGQSRQQQQQEMGRMEVAGTPAVSPDTWQQQAPARGPPLLSPPAADPRVRRQAQGTVQLLQRPRRVPRGKGDESAERM